MFSDFPIDHRSPRGFMESSAGFMELPAAGMDSRQAGLMAFAVRGGGRGAMCGWTVAMIPAYGRTHGVFRRIRGVRVDLRPQSSTGWRVDETDAIDFDAERPAWAGHAAVLRNWVATDFRGAGGFAV